jgi:hypothetical protein
MKTWLSIARVSVLGLMVSGVLHAGGVRNLNLTQSPSYPTLQAAIDEAGEGDVLLVAPGIYPAFTLDGKGLSIVAVESGTARIMDAVTIRNTTTPVWLCGLRIEDDLLNGYVGPVDPGFALENCSGGIRLQDITVVMRRTRTTHITNSSKIATTHSAFVSLRENFMHSEGALTMDGSTMLLHESRVRGSDGFLEEVGTAGLVARNSVLFCAGSHLYGGDGGGADDGDCGAPGDSGLKAPGALVLDNTYHGGAWGPGFIGSCPLPPAPAFIPPLRKLAGRNRSLEASPLLADTAVIAVSVRGVPGDRVWLFEAAQTAFDLDLARNGWWLIPQPGSPSPNPDGIIPQSGVLTLLRNLPLVSPATPVERLELQALIEDAQGAEYLTNARQVWRLSHRSLPDCDGDGLQDIVAVLGGLVLDVDDDLIPDNCALGPQTWFVDASAAPLGTGEPHRPFRDIASGVAKARAGETVIVADGNYTGPGNRNLNFFGRDLSLRSANGPLGCVIDCENLGRALVATHNESLSSLVQGFTIRRGNTEAAQTQNYYNGGGIFVIDCALTVRDCRIENCYASRSGGGVYAGYGELILEHCVMVSNSADSGGGLQIERGSVLVSQTDFEFGRSHFGAGVALDLGSDDVLHAQFSACTLRGNVAVNEAGGVFVIAREEKPRAV